MANMEFTVSSIITPLRCRVIRQMLYGEEFHDWRVDINDRLGSHGYRRELEKIIEELLHKIEYLHSCERTDD